MTPEREKEIRQGWARSETKELLAELDNVREFWRQRKSIMDQEIQTLKDALFKEREASRVEIERLRNEAEEKLAVAVEALDQIEDPRKRTHIEHEAYATIGCMMSIAEQALHKIRGDR